MSHKSENHRIDSLIALVLFGVFAACILSVLLTGSEAYSRLTARDRETFAARTCLQYVSTKVRQAPLGNSIYVEKFDGVDSLCIAENIGGREYITRVYCFDGWLREIFASADTESSADDGEKIIKADSLSLELSDGLLTAELSDGEKLMLSLREGRGSKR